MKKHLRVFLVALFAMAMCLFALVGCGGEPELAPPDISGPASLSLYEGYEATSTEPFTVTGDNVAVTKTSGDEKIAWNGETKRLDIEEGLAAGEYPVVLTASNGNAEKDKTATFTLTVQALIPPSIEGPVSMTLTEGYTKTSTAAYTVAGTNVEVSVITDTSQGKMTWNDAEKKIEIEEGLTAGSYLITLKVSNGKPAQDATLDFALEVRRSPHIEGPSAMELLEGYEGAQHSAKFTIAGVGVTVTKTSGDANITWNDAEKYLDIAAGLAVGTYPVELKASNGNAEEDATFTFTLSVKKVYTVTGTYNYASGTLQGGTHKVEGDNVTISAGNYEATVEDGSYTVHVPEGTHAVTLSSNFFRDVTVDVTAAEGEESTAETATFSIPKLTGEAGKITEVEGGYDLASLGNPTGKTGRFYTLAENVSGSFVVEYEVTLQGSAVFSVPMFFVKAGDGDQWVGLYIWYRLEWNDTPYVRMAVGTNVGRGVNPASGAMKGEAVNGAQPMKMTVAFRDGTYYILAEYTGTDAQPKTLYAKLDSSVTLQWGEEGDSQGNTPVNKADFYGNGARTLAFSAAGDIGRITDISYSLGDVDDLIDETFFRTVTVDPVENGEVQLNNGDLASGGKVFYGTEVTVKVLPSEEYECTTFEVNGEDRRSGLDGGEYTFAVTENTTIEAAFTQVPFYTLTGTYEYTSGTLEGGTYKNANDEVTVKVGTRTATGENGSYSVEVPAGTYTVTLTSKYFRDVVLSGVEVTAEGGTASKATFDKVKFTGTGNISEVDNGYTLTGVANGGPVFTMASGTGNFIATFTMSTTGYAWGGDPCFTVKVGEHDVIGIEFESSRKSDLLGSSSVVRLFAKRASAWSTQMIVKNGLPAVDYNHPVTITIAFKNDTYYLLVEYTGKDGVAAKMVISFNNSSSITYADTQGFKDAERTDFFGSGTRELGFAARNNTVTITDISYKFGDVDTQIDSTFFRTVTVNVVDGTEHGTVTLNSGAITSGNKVLIGTQITVKVTPAGGYQLKTFEVDGTEKSTELQEGVYTFTLAEDTEIRVEFESIPTYELTGTYEYTSGTLTDGVYKNDGDTVTVKVGAYEATGTNGTYSIEVPAGTYEVTLTSKYFREVVKQESVQVTKDGENTVEKATFSLPKLSSGSGISEVENGYTLTAASNGGSVFTMASGTGNFIVKFTMQSAGYAWAGDPFLTVKVGSAKEVGIQFDRTRSSNLVGTGIGIRLWQKTDSGWSNQITVPAGTWPGADCTKPADVTVAFKNGTYYILAEYPGTDSTTVKKSVSFNVGTTFGYENLLTDKVGFFATGTRELGFASRGNTATFTNISYKFGDVDAEIDSTFQDVAAAAVSAPVALPARKEND